MKKIILSSLIAVTMLASCQNSGDTTADKKDTVATESASPAEPELKSSDSLAQADADTTSLTVYNSVSLKTPPAYPGGIQKFYTFLGQNIKYPAEALDKKVQGNVNLIFIIEKDGSVTNIKVDKGLGSGTDEEAVRVLKLSKKWNPGVKDGKPVRTLYKIPIKFSLA